MWVSSPRCAMLVSAYQSPAEPVNPDHGCAADVPVHHLGSDLAGLHLEEVCRILSGDVKHLLLGESRCVDGDRVNASHQFASSRAISPGSESNSTRYTSSELANGPTRAMSLSRYTTTRSPTLKCVMLPPLSPRCRRDKRSTRRRGRCRAPRGTSLPPAPTPTPRGRCRRPGH